MFKKIITFLLTFSIIFSISLAGEKFSIDSVEVITKNKIKVSFTNNIKKSNSLEESFKITDEDKKELIIRKALVNGKNIVLELYDDLKAEDKYKVLVLDLEDINGNTIKKGYDASISFTTPKNFKILEDQEEKNKNDKKNENDKKQEIKINEKNIKSQSSSKILSDEELQEIRKKILGEESVLKEQKDSKLMQKENNKEIKNNSSLEENQENSGEKENINNKKTIVVSDLPTAGATENILFIFALLISFLIFFRKKIS